MMKLCTKFEPIRTIRGGFIAIRIFALMTLNTCHIFRYTLGKFSQSLKSVNLSIREI